MPPSLSWHGLPSRATRRSRARAQLDLMGAFRRPEGATHTSPGQRPISANLFIDITGKISEFGNMATHNAADEEWQTLVNFLPVNWKIMAQQSGALKGLRQDKSVENYLRVLLLHVGCGLSLRETAARAGQSGLAELSDVAVLKRLRKSKEWLRQMCEAMFPDQVAPGGIDAHSLRLVDSTLVREPGPTGSLWRIHYSLRWPQLSCDGFKLTAREGKGNGESLEHYALRKGERVLADRGYCRAGDIHYAAARGAEVLVRFNPDGIRIEDADGQRFALLKHLKALSKAGQSREWPVQVPLEGQAAVPARLCVIRKTRAAIRLSIEKLQREASKDQRTLKPETLRYAEYVMVLTTFPAEAFPTQQVLETYRFRWQVELLFKRVKQHAELGHLPKNDEQSSQAWLYGKMLVALLTEKLLAHARDFSPWG